MLVAYEHHMWANGGGWPERETDYIAHPYSRMVAVADRYENLVFPTDGARPAHTRPSRGRACSKTSSTRAGPGVRAAVRQRAWARSRSAASCGCPTTRSESSRSLGTTRSARSCASPTTRAGSELDDRPDIDLSQGDVRIVEVIDPAALDVAVADKL